MASSVTLLQLSTDRWDVCVGLLGIMMWMTTVEVGLCLLPHFGVERYGLAERPGLLTSPRCTTR